MSVLRVTSPTAGAWRADRTRASKVILAHNPYDPGYGHGHFFIKLTPIDARRSTAVEISAVTINWVSIVFVHVVDHMY